MDFNISALSDREETRSQLFSLQTKMEPALGHEANQGKEVMYVWCPHFTKTLHTDE